MTVYRLILILSVMLSIETYAQTLPLIWSADLEVPANGKLASTYQFDAGGLGDEQYLLDMEATKGPLQKVEVILNGKRVVGDPRVGSMIPLKLLTSNTVKVQITGRTGSRVSFKIVNLNEMSPFVGPINFSASRPLMSVNQNFDIRFPGQYVMKVETSKLGILSALLSHIEVNNQRVFDVRDLLNVFKAPLYKIVDLQEKNRISVFGYGKEGIKLTFYKKGDEPDPSLGQLAFTNLNPSVFNPRREKVLVSLSGANFSLTKSIVVLMNGRPVAKDSLSVTLTQLEIRQKLQDGLNEFSISAYDSAGNTLSLEGEFWAGSSTLRIHVYDPTSNAGVPDANVMVEPRARSAIELTLVSNQNGDVEIDHVPSLPLNLSASLASAYVRLPIPPPASTSDYNLPLTINSSALLSRAALTANLSNSLLTEFNFAGPFVLNQTFPVNQEVLNPIDQGIGSFFNKDGPSVNSQYYMGTSLIRIFVPTPILTKTSLEVVFRVNGPPPSFLGVPGYGFAFGGARQFVPGLPMTALPFQIDDDSASGKFTVKVPLDGRRPPQYVELVLGNWAFNLGLPSAVLETVQFGAGEIVEFKLLDYNPEYFKAKGQSVMPQYIEYLSADYVGGYKPKSTDFYADLTVDSGAGDKIKDIYMELVQGGQVRTKIELSSYGRDQLSNHRGGPLGAILNLKSAPTLVPNSIFTLSQSQASSVEFGKKLGAQLRLVVRTDQGKKLSKMYSNGKSKDGKLKLLADYKGAEWPARYFIRDELAGYDGWGKPKVFQTFDSMRETATALGTLLQANDFSNANGGEFAPHQTHRTGHSIDCILTGWGKKGDSYPSEIASINFMYWLVSLNADDAQAISHIYINRSPAFEDVYRKFKEAEAKGELTIPLSDDEIIDEDGHANHFHIEMRERDDD